MSENQEQIAFWNGPAAERWVRHDAALDRALQPYGAAALQRLRLHGGERVIDLGCGCGSTSRELARRVGPAGRVCGVDISAPMLAHARQQSPDQPWLEFIEVDASTHEFDSPFDVMYSRFGVMFFADPGAAFARLRQALVPHGQLAFVCWRGFNDNPWAHTPLEAARGVLPDAQESFDAKGPGPYAFADPNEVAAILGGAGFAGVRIEQFDADVVFSTTGMRDAVEFATSAGPLSRVLASAPEPARERVLAALATTLEPFRSGDTIALPGSSWIASGSAPGG